MSGAKSYDPEVVSSVPLYHHYLRGLIHRHDHLVHLSNSAFCNAFCIVAKFHSEDVLWVCYAFCIWGENTHYSGVLCYGDHGVDISLRFLYVALLVDFLKLTIETL